jgi:UDP-N-acetylglucosamine 4,6-dehydratase
LTATLITGATGTFGQAYVRHLLDSSSVDRIIVFSRDELKQHAMRTSGFDDPRVRWFIGDVRDRDRLRRAMHGVTDVIHAAALKQVPTCEYNPLEAVRTNVDGTANVIDAAIDAGVERVLMLSSDKACDPVNLYGATKLVAEKLIIDANAYAGGDGTRFAATRYGNVISSRGSVLPLFQQQALNGEPITITDPSMTRFVLTAQHAVRFVEKCLSHMSGGELFVPKLPAVKVSTVAEAVAATVAWHVETRVVGARPGEKHHELLVSANESGRTLDRSWHWLVRPLAMPWLEWDGDLLPAGVAVSSDSTPLLSVAEFMEMAGL